MADQSQGTNLKQGYPLTSPRLVDPHNENPDGTQEVRKISQYTVAGNKVNDG